MSWLREISKIPAALQSSDFQDWLPEVRTLRKGDSAVALPMLLRKVNDGEFMVRSFVAMAWRHSQTADSMAARLKMMLFDRAIGSRVRSRDPIARSQAANSWSMFGTEAIAHLVAAFRRDDNGLVPHSIIARLCDRRLSPKIGCQNAILKIRK
ncbi:hypothetical protein [Microcoleus sp. S13_B4]|uniref:hypothetical protein n=1 Tax=Microcoleus sp. S13_B4 TaxID=3055408 RepID=UPI002FD0960C